MLSTYDKFKKIFISHQNTAQILEKLGAVNVPYHEIQNMQINIFDTHFGSIVSELGRQNKLKFEDVLAILNDLLVKNLSQGSRVDSPSTVSNLVQFSSAYSSFKVGTYTFDYSIDNIKRLSLSSMSLVCNIYNITETNNKFLFTEDNVKSTITIPIGYYNTVSLAECLQGLLTQASPNKLEYNVNFSKIKNKIYIQTSDTFNIEFPQSDFLSLNRILGFTKEQYMNNNIYVAESHPCSNVFDKLYMKVFLDDKEVSQVTMSYSNFTFFETLYLDLDNQFSKCIHIPFQFADTFDVEENLSVSQISFEFWATQEHKMKHFLDFDIILNIESDVN
jgi:hypothetical protein